MLVRVPLKWWVESIPRSIRGGNRFLREWETFWIYTFKGTESSGVNEDIDFLPFLQWFILCCCTCSFSYCVHCIVTPCSTCARSKVPWTLLAGKLNPLPIPELPWSHLSIDFITNLPESQGNTTISVSADRFSKWLRLIPLLTIPSACTTAELLFQHILRYFGIPEEIVSIRGPQFTSQVWSSFIGKMGIIVNITSGYHPQANGQVERANQGIGRFLQTFCASNSEDWSRFLLWAEYAQNSLCHSVTPRSSVF